MKRVCAVCLPIVCLLAGIALPAQQPGASTETPSRPFFIKDAWIIGGAGPWDYLTLDPSAERLYIAHGHSVQVVDVHSGTLAGEVSGLGEAHAIALDDTGEFGYISDGLAGKVIVFDRRSLQTVAAIEGVPSPRALVFEPQTGLLFAVRTGPAPAPRTPPVPRTTTHITPRPAPPAPPPPNPAAVSSLTVIDTKSQRVVGRILISGTLGFAQADGRGEVFVNVTDRNEILRLDAQAVGTLLHKQADGGSAQPDPAHGEAARQPAAATLDWTETRDRPYSTIRLAGQCTTPKSLAIDAAHSRLFAACDNMKLLVLNADSSQVVATLPIGPGTDAIGYDSGRGLIYSANGGADGSLTIISQSVTDGYAVIQTLPTRQRARTLAVNPENGQVYLVTDLLGVNLAQSGGIGRLQTNPVNGSFQVLVVGQ